MTFCFRFLFVSLRFVFVRFFSHLCFLSSCIHINVDDFKIRNFVDDFLNQIPGAYKNDTANNLILPPPINSSSNSITTNNVNSTTTDFDAFCDDLFSGIWSQ